MLAITCLAFLLVWAPATAAAAEVTVGADVTQMPATSGTCAVHNAAYRPCVVVNTPAALPGRNAVSPCNGTVTRFRLNGIPKPADHYRLRVLRENPDGSFTGTATGAQVQITSDGVNEYVTELPIAKGEYIAVDFQDSSEDLGLRWVGPGSEILKLVFFAFPADGEAAFASELSYSYYLFNADVACVGEGEGGEGDGTPPGVGPGPLPTGPSPSVATPPDFATAIFDGKALRVRLKCPARFKPRCLGHAVAVTATVCHRRHGHRQCRGGVPMTGATPAAQKAGKWRVAVLSLKPKYRKLVAKMAKRPQKKLLLVRQTLHAKRFRRGRQQAVLHRYRVRSG